MSCWKKEKVRLPLKIPYYAFVLILCLCLMLFPLLRSLFLMFFEISDLRRTVLCCQHQVWLCKRQEPCTVPLYYMCLELFKNRKKIGIASVPCDQLPISPTTYTVYFPSQSIFPGSDARTRICYFRQAPLIWHWKIQGSDPFDRRLVSLGAVNGPSFGHWWTQNFFLEGIRKIHTT